MSLIELALLDGRRPLPLWDVIGLTLTLTFTEVNVRKPIKSRRMRWAGHVARMGETRNACRILVGMPEGKRPLGRPRRRWVDSIKMDLGEIGWDGVDWIWLRIGTSGGLL
jgi:hypothetical protein